MISINPRITLKTRIAKGSIKAGAMVTVSDCGDREFRCEVKDVEGNEEEYTIDELMCFGLTKQGSEILDIVEKDEHNSNEDRIFYKCYTHMTENVRGCSTWGKQIVNDFLFIGNIDGFRGFDYQFKELTDDQVIEYLLEDVLYKHQPDLQSMSCVGTSSKGIDKDPNYRNGHYILVNNKEYTMTYCYNQIKIREGIDGGWYHNKEKAGRTLYEGEIDFDRLKKAKIYRSSITRLSKGESLFDQIPGLQEFIVNHIKEEDQFKLNSEF